MNLDPGRGDLGDGGERETDIQTDRDGRKDGWTDGRTDKTKRENDIQRTSIELG